MPDIPEQLADKSIHYANHGELLQDLGKHREWVSAKKIQVLNSQA